MQLHGYFRSSASYRVRVALNLKGLDYKSVSVHLGSGEQFNPGFRRLNAQALVPVLAEAGTHFAQSLAIIEYLEERYPTPPLLPASPEDRAYVREVSLGVACDIHPLNNLRVLKYLTGVLGVTEEQKAGWLKHWIALGFEALESRLASSGKSGTFCLGDSPSMADCCLVPQVFSAHRFDVDMSAYPRIAAIHAACEQLPAFADAHPARQPDAV